MHVAYEWQVTKQLSKLNPPLLSNNKNYRLKKVEFFLGNKRKTVVKPTIHKIQLPQKDYWENFKITEHKYRFWILKIIVTLTGTVYSLKLLSNH